MNQKEKVTICILGLIRFESDNPGIKSIIILTMILIFLGSLIW